VWEIFLSSSSADTPGPSQKKRWGRLSGRGEEKPNHEKLFLDSNLAATLRGTFIPDSDQKRSRQVASDLAKREHNDQGRGDNQPFLTGLEIRVHVREKKDKTTRRVTSQRSPGKLSASAWISCAGKAETKPRERAQAGRERYHKSHLQKAENVRTKKLGGRKTATLKRFVQRKFSHSGRETIGAQNIPPKGTEEEEDSFKARSDCGSGPRNNGKRREMAAFWG